MEQLINNNKQHITPPQNSGELKTIKKEEKGFLKKHWAKITTIAVTCSAVGLLIGAGYMSTYSRNYDVVVAVNKKNNLNYITGSGKTTRAVKSMFSGWTTNTISSQSSAYLINEDSYWTTDEAQLVQDGLKMIVEPDRSSLPPEQAGKNTTYQKTTVPLEIGQNEEVLNSNSAPAYYPSTIAEDLIGELYLYSDTTSNSSSIRIYTHWTDDDGNGIADGPTWSSGNIMTIYDFIYGIMTVGWKGAGSSQNYMYEFTNINGIMDWQQMQKNSEGEVVSFEESSEYFLQNVACNYDINSTACGGVSPLGDEYGIVYSEKEGWIQYNFSTASSAEYFLGMMHSVAFQPLDSVFLEDTLGEPGVPYDANVFRFGISADTISSYGPLTITSFNPNYGYEAVKNEEWKYADAVSSDTYFFRVITEPATAVSQFNSDELTYIYGTELTSPLFAQDSNTAYWNDPTYSGPTSKFIVYNLDPTTNTPNSKYYKNPNFRRAVQYGFDRNIYYNFIGNIYASSSSQLAADKTGTFMVDGGTSGVKPWPMEDLLKNQTYSVPIDSDNDGKIDTAHPTETIMLGAYDSTDRESFLGANGRPGREEGDKDPLTNETIALYYWEEFLEDMNAIGETPTSQITIEYKTVEGEQDKLVKALNESMYKLFNSEEGKKYLINGEVPVYFLPVKVSDTYAAFENGDYEMLAMAWNPDYISAWASQLIFTSTDKGLSRAYNLSGAWNFWTGSLFTFGFGEGKTYDEADMQEVLSWADDGILMWMTGTSETIPTSAQTYIDQAKTVSGSTNIPNIILDHDFSYDTGDTFSPLNGYTAVSSALDNGELVKINYPDDGLDIEGQSVTTGSPDDTPVSNANGKTYVHVQGPLQTEIDALTSSTTDKLNAEIGIFFEIVYRYAAPVVQYGNALPEINPSYGAFRTTPIIGYPHFGFMYDVNMPPIDGMPDKDAILSSRGKK